MEAAQVTGFSTFLPVRCVFAFRLVLFFSKVVFRQIPAMVIGFEPMVQKELVQIRSDNFLAEFVGLGTQEWHAEPRQTCDEGLGDSIRVYPAVRVGRFYLAERGGDHQ